MQTMLQVAESKLQRARDRVTYGYTRANAEGTDSGEHARWIYRRIRRQDALLRGREAIHASTLERERKVAFWGDWLL